MPFFTIICIVTMVSALAGVGVMNPKYRNFYIGVVVVMAVLAIMFTYSAFGRPHQIDDVLRYALFIGMQVLAAFGWRIYSYFMGVAVDNTIADMQAEENAAID